MLSALSCKIQRFLKEQWCLLGDIEKEDMSVLCLQ